MTWSNNCRNHKDFQKALAEFFPPQMGKLQCLPEPVANAGSWQGWAMVRSFRAFYFCWLKQGIISHLRVLPQEWRGMDKGTDTISLQPHPCFGSEIICSELNQLRDILLAVPDTARRARHCHTDVPIHMPGAAGPAAATGASQGLLGVQYQLAPDWSAITWDPSEMFRDIGWFYPLFRVSIKLLYARVLAVIYTIYLLATFALIREAEDIILFNEIPEIFSYEAQKIEGNGTS